MTRRPRTTSHVQVSGTWTWLELSVHRAEELAPERIVRLEEDGPAVVLLDQRRLPDEVVEVRCARRRRWPRRSGRSPCAARPRSASPPPTGSRSPRSAERISPRPSSVLARVAADRGQPRLGARADARRPDTRACAGAPRGGGRALPADGRARGGAVPAGHARAHALQRRRARDRRLRLRRRRAPRRRGARAARRASSSTRRGRSSRARASPPGSSSSAGIPHAVIADSAAGVADGRAARSTSWSPAPTGSPRTGTRRTRSGHTRSPCSPPTTGSRSTSSRRPRRSTARRPTAPAIPIEERDPAELTSRFPARNPAFDVTPAALIAAIVTEHGVHRAPYEESLPREGASILAAGYATRLRPLTDDDAQAAAPGRRAADARLGPRRRPRGRGRRRDPPRHEQPLRADLRASGPRPTTWPSTTTARPRTTTGSARSATSGS